MRHWLDPKTRLKAASFLVVRQIPLPGIALPPFPEDRVLLFDANTTNRITLTVYSSTRLTSNPSNDTGTGTGGGTGGGNGTRTRPGRQVLGDGDSSGSGPGTGPRTSTGSQWLLLGRFVAPTAVATDPNAIRNAALGAEFDWLEVPAVTSVVVSFAALRTVEGKMRASMTWRSVLDG